MSIYNFKNEGKYNFKFNPNLKNSVSVLGGSYFSRLKKFLVIKNGLINQKLLIKNYPIVVEINPKMKLPVHKLNHVYHSFFLFCLLFFLFSS